MNTEMISVSGPRMRLPLQAAPVMRSMLSSSALSGMSGVEPSGWFEDVVNTIKTIGSTVQTVAPIVQGIASAW